MIVLTDLLLRLKWEEPEGNVYTVSVQVFQRSLVVGAFSNSVERYIPRRVFDSVSISGLIDGNSLQHSPLSKPHKVCTRYVLYVPHSCVLV